MPPTLEGSLPALATPMRSPGEVDLAGYVKLCERALADGASGVLVAGTTGEGPLLTPEDRREMTRAVAASGGLVLACASGATLDDVHRDVASLAGAGAQYVLVLAPNYYTLEPDEQVDAHRAVAERADVPTLVYHIPQLTGSALTPEAVAVLSRHDGIAGMKDSSGDAARQATFVREAAGGFAVMTGHGVTLATSLRAGAAGSITAIANVRQRHVVALHEAVAAGDDAEADRLQEAITACESGLGAVPGVAAAAIKAALQLEGVIEERWCAPPLRAVEPAHLDHIRTALLR